jgi:hypothetical protein
MSRVRNHRLKVGGCVLQLESNRVNFWLLLQTAPNGRSDTLKTNAIRQHIKDHPV